VDPRVPRRRKSRAQFKRIRRNRRARKEVLDIINRLLDQVTESLANFPLVFPSPSSPSHISSPISEERFPSLQDTYLLHYLLQYLHFLQPTTHHPLSHHPYSDVSPSPSSTSSVEFLGEGPAPFSPLQSYVFEKLPFILIATHFPEANNSSPPGAYTIGPGEMDLEDLRRVAPHIPVMRLSYTFLGFHSLT